MQKTKPKRGLNSLAQGVLFAILWAIILAILSAFMNRFTETPAFVNLTPLQMSVILVLWPYLVGGWVQIQLIERFLKRSMRGWLLYSLVGSLITVILGNLLYTVPDWAARLPDTLKLSVYLFPVLLQSVWMWRHVKKAWLWPLITVITYLGLNSVFMNSPRLVASPIVPPLVLLYSLIEGGIMYYLVTRPKNAEKAKVDVATDDTADEARVQRLQEAAQDRPLWDGSEEQMRQSEA